jgi:hypothetical protein
MSYNLKGTNVERDGVVIAVINEETAKLDFVEGASNYRNHAVKHLRKLELWDDEKDIVILAKLDLAPPVAGAETEETGYKFTYLSDGLLVELDGERIAVLSKETGGLIYNKDCENYSESIYDALKVGILWNNDLKVINLDELRRLCLLHNPEPLEAAPFELDKLEVKQGDVVVAVIDLETGKLLFATGFGNVEGVVAMLNELELWDDVKEQVNIEALRERYPNEVFGKTKEDKPEAKEAGEIKTVKALVAAMQPHISEVCPAMSRRLGDKTPEVLKWIKKHDKIRKKVLKK